MAKTTRRPKHPKMLELGRALRNASTPEQAATIKAQLKELQQVVRKQYQAEDSARRKAATAALRAERKAAKRLEKLRNRKTKDLSSLTDEEKRLYHLHKKVWHAMKFRCYSQKCTQYKDYGGRGIKVCDRWLESFDNFLSDMGFRPFADYQLDRINNDGNYEPDNCRWVSRSVNMLNRRVTSTIPRMPNDRRSVSVRMRDNSRKRSEYRYYGQRIARELLSLTPLSPSPVTASVLAHYAAVSGVKS